MTPNQDLLSKWVLVRPFPEGGLTSGNDMVTVEVWNSGYDYGQ